MWSYLIIWSNRDFDFESQDFKDPILSPKAEFTRLERVGEKFISFPKS